MRKYLAVCLALLIFAGALMSVSAAEERGFSDVAEDAYYSEAVLWAVDEGITKGVSSERFAPNEVCTRGQIVTFLWRAKGSPEPSGTENPFADVSEGMYCHKAILWAVEQGITKGLSETRFGVDLPCTRGQAVTFLYRAEGEPSISTGSSCFTDTKPTDYCYVPVVWASKQGITNGISETVFGVDRPCTRGQIVTLLFRDRTKVSKELNHFYYDEVRDRYIYQGSYEGAYSVQKVDLDSSETTDFPFEMSVMTLEQYSSFCERWGFTQEFDEECSYLVAADAAPWVPILEVDLGGVTYNAQTKTACLYIYEHTEGVTGDFQMWMIAVPTKAEVESVTFRLLHDINEPDEIDPMPVFKPVLYLYPEVETELTVRVGKPEELTCTYPVYNDGWQITACPDGTLYDASGRSYYALYWEGGRAPKLSGEGFCVARSEIVPFLEQSLADLGLTEREAEEFIIYWLPELQQSPYVRISFATTEVMNEVMPLEFSTQPDTLIRVLMEYAPLEQPVELAPQMLTAPSRTGFVAVEWGGAKMPLG